MSANFPLPWLTRLLRTKFYEECTEADYQCKQSTTFFCKDCENNNAFCKSCKTNSNKHGGHEVVQVSFIFPSHGGYFYYVMSILPQLLVVIMSILPFYFGFLLGGESSRNCTQD